jgi:hypothetical protein
MRVIPGNSKGSIVQALSLENAPPSPGLQCGSLPTSIVVRGRSERPKWDFPRTHMLGCSGSQGEFKWHTTRRVWTYAPCGLSMGRGFAGRRAGLRRASHSHNGWTAGLGGIIAASLTSITVEIPMMLFCMNKTSSWVAGVLDNGVLCPMPASMR